MQNTLVNIDISRMTARLPFQFKSAILLSAACLTLLSGCQSSPKAVANIDSKKGLAEVQMSADRESLLSLQSPDSAIQARGRILKADGTLSESLLLTVSELSLLGSDLPKAREIARSRLKKNYNDVEAMNILIRASLAEGKLAEVHLLVDNALAIDSRNPNTLNLKGLALYQQNRLIEARETWKRVLKYDPTHVASMMNLGALYFKNRNISQSAALFERIIALQPGHLDARVGFALVRYSQGEPEQARGMLEKILDNNETSPLVLFNLAVLERDGFRNYTKSLVYMERFVDAASKVSTARKSLENGLILVSQLKSKIAADKQKLSDADLRSLASSPGGTGAAKSDTGPSKKAELGSSSAGRDGDGSGSIMDRDVQSLEDAIK
jgi:tetratricopeptide (TPR) repeat protein